MESTETSYSPLCLHIWTASPTINICTREEKMEVCVATIMRPEWENSWRGPWKLPLWGGYCLPAAVTSVGLHSSFWWQTWGHCGFILPGVRSRTACRAEKKEKAGPDGYLLSNGHSIWSWDQLLLHVCFSNTTQVPLLINSNSNYIGKGILGNTVWALAKLMNSSTI